MKARVCASCGEAVTGTPDGRPVLVGGFGTAGMPVDVVDALIRQGATDLPVVSNAGNGDTGLAALLAADRVRKVIRPFRRQADSGVSDGLYREGPRTSPTRWGSAGRRSTTT